MRNSAYAIATSNAARSLIDGDTVRQVGVTIRDRATAQACSTDVRPWAAELAAYEDSREFRAIDRTMRCNRNRAFS